MRNVAAPALAVAVVAASLWATAACGSFSADAGPNGAADGGADGGGADGPNGGADGSNGADGSTNPGLRHVYVIGGEVPPAGGTDDAGTSFTGSVVFATQQPDGALTSWAETKPFSPVHGNAAVATSGAVVSLGGEVSTGAGDTAVDVAGRAATSTDGSLAPWTSTRALPDRLYFHASVVVNGRVYVLGGNKPGAGTIANVRFGTLAANGTIDAWTETTPLPQGRARLAAATDGSHIYVVGGSPSAGACSVSVLVGTVGPNGDVPTWRDAGQVLEATSPAAVVFANKLFILGGFGCGGIGTLGDVKIAAIAPDGTLGAYTKGAPLVAPTSGLGAVVLGQRLYAVGGNDGAAPVPAVHVADLGPNGDYDAWHAGPPLPMGRSLFGIAAY